MRSFRLIFTALLFCVALAAAQQTPSFKAGDAVEYYTFGRWLPCTITAPLADGFYSIHCGVLDFRGKPGPQELRAVATAAVAPPASPAPAAAVVVPEATHATAVPSIAVAPATQTAPVSAVPRVESAPVAVDKTSVGARYGTRQPRTCDHRTEPSTAAAARAEFICDAEHEANGSLYLVSDVSVEVAKQRTYSPVMDAALPAIDPAAPVYDIKATYNDFQCSPIPYNAQDNPESHNCKMFRLTNATGGCFKSQSAEWHCLIFDSKGAAGAVTNNVRPPTLNE